MIEKLISNILLDYGLKPYGYPMKEMVYGLKNRKIARYAIHVSWE